MTIDIIGGGIGGLTTAIALEQKGFKTRVFEQAQTIRSVGAGIILANNAMQIFEKLGLRDVLEQNGNPVSSLSITKANLKPLSTVDLSDFENKFNVKNIAIHRGILQQVLIEQLSPGTLHLDYKLKNISKTSAGYTLEFFNGEVIQSNILIGADGLHSTIRKELFTENTIRKANQLCWRGITDYNLPQKYQNALCEAWDKSGRFGFVQIADCKVYWYALKSFKKESKELSVQHLNAYFQMFDPLVTDLIAKTDKTQIYTAEIADLKPTNQWFQDNVCLIGDAAHAATPNMGQGACQAIEDAYVLAACLSRQESNMAFKEFHNIRKEKVNLVVKTSWRIGKISHLSNPIGVGLRNFMVRMAPASINKKQLEQIFKIPSL